MRVFIDYENPSEEGSVQIFRDDISGRELSFEEMNHRILLDSYENKFGQIVLVFTDHTFEDHSK